MNYRQISALILAKYKKLINFFYIYGYNRARQTKSYRKREYK